MQREAGLWRSGDREQIRAVNVFEPERWAWIGAGRRDLDMRHIKVLQMTDKEARLTIVSLCCIKRLQELVAGTMI